MDKTIAMTALAAMIQGGADKASCVYTTSDKKELNAEAGAVTLLRTTLGTNLALTALVDGRKGSASINKSDDASIAAAAKQAIEYAGASEADDANAIAENQPTAGFSLGIDAPDQDKMFDRMQEFLRDAKAAYPKTILEQCILDFTSSETHFVNSNGVDYVTRAGHYNFMAMFTSKDGEKSSSFNYSGFSTNDLERPFLECGTLRTLIEQSAEQIETGRIGDKFTGDILVTPDCLDDIIGFVTESIGNYAMISGTSIYGDKLDEAIASDKLTLRSMPLHPEIVGQYRVTGDGYLAEDCTVIDKGVLKTFLLNLYGSLKTGRKRAVNDGGCYVIDPGDTGYDEMLASVDRGVLLCRFSGGQPSNNGDFSGVAKNSYYIENGKLKHPISETMISGNIAELLKNIKAISKERINFGSSIYPWMLLEGVTVSGK